MDQLKSMIFIIDIIGHPQAQLCRQMWNLSRLDDYMTLLVAMIRHTCDL